MLWRRWISLLGALMSCGYCTIATVMSAVHAARHGPAANTTHDGLSTADRVFSVFNALGGVAFTFGGARRVQHRHMGRCCGCCAGLLRPGACAPSCVANSWLS
jgi:aerobic-type carbon monoxide dehydrogenase small subunit (CoxS/CutS family)